MFPRLRRVSHQLFELEQAKWDNSRKIQDENNHVSKTNVLNCHSKERDTTVKLCSQNDTSLKNCTLIHCGSSAFEQNHDSSKNVQDNWRHKSKIADIHRLEDAAVRIRQETHNLTSRTVELGGVSGNDPRFNISIDLSTI